MDFKTKLTEEICSESLNQGCPSPEFSSEVTPPEIRDDGGFNRLAQSSGHINCLVHAKAAGSGNRPFWRKSGMPWMIRSCIWAWARYCSSHFCQGIIDCCFKWLRTCLRLMDRPVSMRFRRTLTITLGEGDFGRPHLADFACCSHFGITYKVSQNASTASDHTRRLMGDRQAMARLGIPQPATTSTACQVMSTSLGGPDMISRSQ